MNIRTKEALLETIKLIKSRKIDDNLEDFSPYKSVYFWTNEDIKQSLEQLKDRNKDKALTVLSSGDHLFNLLVDGYQTVDTFDINSLSEYTSLGLKRAMILKYSLEEFKKRMDYIKTNTYTRDEEIDQIIDCFPYMETKHKEFFQSLIDTCYDDQSLLKKDDHLLDFLLKKKRTVKSDRILGNNYLDSTEEYELLKKRLNDTDISFTKRNILVPSKKKNNYDLIYLSNILDYAFIDWNVSWKYHQLKKLENSLEKELNKEGILLLYYFFYYDENLNHYFNNPAITEKKIKKEEIVTFHNSYDDDCAIMIKRKGKHFSLFDRR